MTYHLMSLHQILKRTVNNVKPKDKVNQIIFMYQTPVQWIRVGTRLGKFCECVESISI